MIDVLQPFSTSVSVDGTCTVVGCCAEFSCQHRILKHRKISCDSPKIGSYMYGLPLTIAAFRVAHFARQSSLIMDANHFCSTLFFLVQRIEPLLLVRSEKYLGRKTAIRMWKQMQNYPICYDFFLFLALNHLLLYYLGYYRVHYGGTFAAHHLGDLSFLKSRGGGEFMGVTSKIFVY